MRTQAQTMAAIALVAASFPEKFLQHLKNPAKKFMFTSAQRMD
jgi:hypothetical protein